MNKEAVYKETLRRIEALVEGENDVMCLMSTVCCELFHAFDHWNWVGFYRNVGSQTLKVGPYQGTHGCLTIDFSRGVCGKCASEKAIQLHNDVTQLPHHIACSSDTMAEIVLPVIDSNGDIYAVFDIDSIEADVFDDLDKVYLSRVVALIEQRL